jgi:hypothetical protein
VLENPTVQAVYRDLWVEELPDRKSTLGKLLISPEYLLDLRQIYSEEYPFTESTYNVAIQTVKGCYEARHEREERKFLSEVQSPEVDVEVAFSKYLSNLRAPHKKPSPAEP